MAINIKVDENYRLTSDSYNVIINKRKVVDPTKSPKWDELKKNGASPELREEWYEIGYYKTTEGALHSLLERKVRESDATTLYQLAHEIKQYRREIGGLVGVGKQ